LYKTSLIRPDLIEAVVPYLKCSEFTQMFLILPKTRMTFLISQNLMKAVGIPKRS